jgi:hypothetical protein
MSPTHKQPWDQSSEAEGIRFQQKRGGRRVRISIDRNGVDYEIRDANGESRFKASFEQIDPAQSHVVEKNIHLLQLGAIWTLLCLVTALSCLKDPSPAAWALPASFLLMSGYSFFNYFWRKAAFTILRSDSGRICIIDGPKRDEILSELNSRRVATLRAKYLHLDHENHKKAEISKYNWLRRVGAITDVELSQFASMLQGDKPALPSLQPPTISLN